MDNNKELQYWSGNEINQLKPNEIFVFGSNPQARHFAGAARAALKFGAVPLKRTKSGDIPGIARGLSKQTYALITKSLEAGFREESTGIIYDKQDFRSVSESQIRDNIKELYECARQNPDKQFLITYQYQTWPNGSPKKSLNGYTSHELLEMFLKEQNIPENIVFHDSYQPHVEKILKKDNFMDNTNKNEFTFFWKTHSPFSQWHPSIFELNNHRFTSAEQFMMFCKASLFKDSEIAKKIMDMNNEVIILRDTSGNEIGRKDSVLKKYSEGQVTQKDILNDKELLKEWNAAQKKIKDSGREVKNYNEKIWSEKRINYVARGSYEKFSQNKDIKDILMATGNSIMVEASPYDKIWGIGMGKDDLRAKIPSKWLGLNLLGKVLTNLKIKFAAELENDNAVNQKQKIKM